MKTTHAALKIGQKVKYIERTSYGLVYDWDATVVRITPKRVAITRDNFPNWKPIIVNPSSLRISREVPS